MTLTNRLIGELEDLEKREETLWELALKGGIDYSSGYQQKLLERAEACTQQRIQIYEMLVQLEGMSYINATNLPEGQ